MWVSMTAALAAMSSVQPTFSLSRLARVSPLPLVSSGGQCSIDVAAALADGNGIKLLVLGTYPADFNMIEYAQKLTYYLPELKAKGVSRVLCAVNGEQASVKKLSELVSLPDDIEMLSDSSGALGREFGVARGWLPDDETVSPYIKLLGMLVGLGAANTLPSVITGYLGNPWGKQGWIERALAQGQQAGRWPDVALDLDAATGRVQRNAFDELPLVGGWGRRPLELATLRLQNMVGISLAHWSDLQPNDERCLTQLGGLLAVDPDGNMIYEWRDNGICAVANFEELLEAL